MKKMLILYAIFIVLVIITTLIWVDNVNWLINQCKGV